MGMNDQAFECHEIAKESGFWDDVDATDFVFQAKQLAMIHSEVTEVLEALRKSKSQLEVVEELADILIRVYDFYWGLLEAGVVHSSLEDVFWDKMKKNMTRPRMHGVRG